MMGKQLCLTFLRFALVTPMLSLTTFAQEKPLRPNVVYIVSDDQGWKDVGYHGSDIKTPMHARLTLRDSHTTGINSGNHLCSTSRLSP
jgi:hypothetical protein